MKRNILQEYLLKPKMEKKYNDKFIIQNSQMIDQTLWWFE